MGSNEPQLLSGDVVPIRASKISILFQGGRWGDQEQVGGEAEVQHPGGQDHFRSRTWWWDASLAGPSQPKFNLGWLVWRKNLPSLIIRDNFEFEIRESMWELARKSTRVWESMRECERAAGSFIVPTRVDMVVVWPLRPLRWSLPINTCMWNSGKT